MTEEFIKKLNSQEYISANLFRFISKEYPNIIPSNFNLDVYNDAILEKLYAQYKDYFKNMYKGIDNNIELDENQIKAILRDEDYTLIIAGAGTGKTTTMVSKVKYLVDIKKVDSSKILVMSYSKKATEELENRILLDFGIPATVATFHSLGFSYIREIFKDKKCYVVDTELRNKIFIDFFKKEIFPNKNRLHEVMNIFNATSINKPWAFSKYFKENENKFTSFEEFFETYKRDKIKEVKNLQEFVEDKIEREMNRDDSIRTIKGEMVKSKGEAIIANFLFRNGIDYYYEKLYEKLLDNNKTYKPDFTIELGGEEIYIEYFSLSSNDNSSNATFRYEKIKQKKIQYHKEHHTKFISIDYMKSTDIENTLRQELIKLGFNLKQKTYEEIYDQILSNNPTSQIYPFKDFLYDLIDTLKSSTKRNEYQTLIKDYIERFDPEMQDTLKKQFLYFKAFLVYYQKTLLHNTENYGFDFSDMIYYANKYLDTIKTTDAFKFEYIIIDEYQDISSERYLFTKKISELNNSKVIAVGDDWQTIYSFSGSRISYIYNFPKYFKGSKVIRITKSYRNSQELSDYSGDFIMKNPSQIKKRLISDKSLPHPIKFVTFKQGAEYDTLKKLILYIHKQNPTHKIMILARNNQMIDDCYKEDELKDEIGSKIEFVGYEDIELDGMTIHKSKGLTTDEVILIGLNKNFPSREPSSFWIKLLFKNKNDDEGIDFAEERRLFYVALTRTKNNVYLLVNEKEEYRSPFINELLLIMKEER